LSNIASLGHSRGMTHDHSKADDPGRPALIRKAFILEWVTLGWVFVVEALGGLWAAFEAHSISLLAFGADSLIETASACLLLWRLNVELQHGQRFSERAERIASRVSGALLFALAAYVVLSAMWGLWTHHSQSFSFLGVAATGLAIPVMAMLARLKIDVAEKINSPALRADGMESVTCGWLSIIVLVGLAAQYLLHVWWIDSVISLGILYFLIKEGREAWSGEGCSDHDH
jgi:divalent metal cation (Fe/Co/Zn/Cd) transporter